MATPLAQAMIVCDAAHRDRTTGKFFLLGTFSTIFARTLPCNHGQLCLFIVITECRDRTPIMVRLVRVSPSLGDDDVLAEVRAEVNSPDPLAVHELALHMREVKFDRAGEYRFQLLSEGELLMEKRLVVIHKPPAEPAG